jgi:hypothetical protein
MYCNEKTFFPPGKGDSDRDSPEFKFQAMKIDLN